MDRRGIPRRVVRLLVLERTLLALLLRTILSLLEQIGGHVDSERRGTKGREHRTVARDCCELRVTLQSDTPHTKTCSSEQLRYQHRPQIRIQGREDLRPCRQRKARNKAEASTAPMRETVASRVRLHRQSDILHTQTCSSERIRYQRRPQIRIQGGRRPGYGRQDRSGKSDGEAGNGPIQTDWYRELNKRNRRIGPKQGHQENQHRAAGSKHQASMGRQAAKQGNTRAGRVGAGGQTCGRARTAQQARARRSARAANKPANQGESDTSTTVKTTTRTRATVFSSTGPRGANTLSVTANDSAPQLRSHHQKPRVPSHEPDPAHDSREHRRSRTRVTSCVRNRMRKYEPARSRSRWALNLK